MSPALCPAARTVDMRRFLLAFAFLFSLAGSLPGAVAPPPTFTIGWSVYVGWNPYQYMATLRDAQKVGGQVRRRDQGAAVRLCAVAGCVRREEYRRLRYDQYGGARHARCSRRRHHGDHRGRLFERQRRGAGAPQLDARPDPRQARAAGRENCFAVFVRARHGA